MILQSLNQLYGRLPGIDKPGFAPMGLSWAIVLSPEGELESLISLRQPAEHGKKLIPTPMSAPSPGKRTSGDKAGFVADKTDYVLGFDPAAMAAPEHVEKLAKRFNLFRDIHLTAQRDISHPDFDLLCHFLVTWQPQAAGLAEKLAQASNASVEEIIGSNLTFQIRGKTGFVHQLPEVIDYWSAASSTSSEGTRGFCLVTGQEQPLARLHDPVIKHVTGAQSSGASLVSFNLSAFLSYGKEQGLNAPVGNAAAFAYCTTLNWLLSERHRRFRIGDATAVFWTAEPTPAENLLPWMISGTPESEDDETKQRVQSVLDKISRGILGHDDLGDARVTFFFLGLSPNASRLSVRFWHTGTLGDLLSNLRRHFEQLRLVRQWDESNSNNPDLVAPSAYQLLRQTARAADGIPPLLGGALMRSILLGTRYPDALISGVMNRIRVVEKKPKGEGSLDNVSYLRASILKAWLIRNHHIHITEMLDETNTNIGYRLGRLFAVLEKTQQDALPGLSATIRERFYSSASASPRAVFGRLLRTYQHHLAKLDIGAKIAREKQAQDILCAVTDFPAHLNLKDQAQFALGYYHQRKDLFTKKETAEATPA